MSQTDSSVAARQHVSDPFRLSIGFDADDTLWHCERDFDQIQQRFGELLAPWMERDTAATSHLEAIERRNLEIFGYGVKGFTLSMVESAIQLSDGGVGADEIQQIIDWGKDLLGAGGRGLELIDDVEITLAALSHRGLTLITKGDLPEPLPAEAPFARISLTLPRLLRARTILLVATGEDKRRVLRQARQQDRGGHPVAALLHARDDRVQVHWSP